MKSDQFWSVELCVRMGPFILGTEYESLFQILRDHHVNVNDLIPDRLRKLSVPEIHTQFVFSETTHRTLDRIDVEDPRIRFGPLAVMGKRAHEIIGMFKVPRKQTLWCSIEKIDEASHQATHADSNQQSRELLARGTIWIPSLGLGLTLRDGLVAKVHLCDPEKAPRIGTGLWTKEQQRLSEVRELPAPSSLTTVRNRKILLSVTIHCALVVSLGILVYWAIQLQRKWNVAPEVPAVVVALDPPPPHPLPERITLQLNDSKGTERRHTLGYMQFCMTPTLGDEVNIRYLPDAPDEVLGPVAARDVGFESALPYGIGILAIYSFLQLIVLGASRFRARRTR